jgi:hypothetical protein
MTRAVLVGFVQVPLVIAVMCAGLPPARAESLSIVVSTSNNPGTGTPVTCPLQLPPAGTLPLPAPGARLSILNFFDCEFTVAGAGTFMVYGFVDATNVNTGGANGFNSFLRFVATVVVEVPAVAQVSVSISATETYQIPPLVASSFSDLQVDGTCNSGPDSVIGLSFSNPGSNPVPIGGGASSFPCPAIAYNKTAVPGGGGGGLLTLANTGSAHFPFGVPVGGAVTLQMQQVAYDVGGGPAGPFVPPPPPPSPVCTLPAPGICADFMNQFVPPPDPATGFAMVYAGDVRNLIAIGNMGYDPTINPFAYQFPDQAGALMSLDSNGNTVVTFVGPPLTGNETYCYNGPTSCNKNPHFGVDALAQSCTGVTCPTLRLLSQYWTNTPNITLPSLSVDGPGLTGPTVDFVTVFADVTAGGNVVGQWFTKPYSTNAPPQLCLENQTASGETLSDVGFLVKPIAVLQSMNSGQQPPPGQPGSPFISVPSLNGRFLPSGGIVCFTAGVKPDIAVTNGNPTGQGVLTIPVNLNNTGGVDASRVTITSIKPTLPATYIGPAIPLTVGNIAAGSEASQNITIDTTGLPSGSVARFQINGSFQDGFGNNFQFSAVRGVKVP